VVSAVLTLVCYGFVLRLPFFLDDLAIMTWLSRHSWVEIWVRSSENQFRRPLAFAIYKLGRLLPAGADRGFLHGVSLLIHWTSAVLIMQVLRVADRSAEEALVASIPAGDQGLSVYDFTARCQYATMSLAPIIRDDHQRGANNV
jgi:hypothetical protein